MQAHPIRIGRHVINVNDDQPTFWAKVAADRWEVGTLAAIDQVVREDTLFLDIGAWVGPISLYAAFTAKRVVAIEADPVALDQLIRNIDANPELAPRIDVVPRAFHWRHGTARMNARRKPGDSMSSLLPLSGTTWAAPTITPADLVALASSHDDVVLKMDLEGAEYDLLPKMQNLLARTRAAIVSFHPNILREIGFDDVDIVRREALAEQTLGNFKRSRIGIAGAHHAEAAEWLFVRL